MQLRGSLPHRLSVRVVTGAHARVRVLLCVCVCSFVSFCLAHAQALREAFAYFDFAKLPGFPDSPPESNSCGPDKFAPEWAEPDKRVRSPTHRIVYGAP
jgi:hypothetical protein